MKKKVLITGITGMDGSHLADLLLENDCKVYGLVRRNSSQNFWRIKHIEKDIELISGDMQDQSSLDRAVKSIQPDEIYNLAAQSFVKESFNVPEYTADVTGLGALRLFESVRTNCPSAKVYQAGSSEMFGNVQEVPQKETTIFYPRSPYGCAKVFAHYAAINYRESYGLFICNGIAFNHESERRGAEFVTKKITQAVARISLGDKRAFSLGNTSSSRDWGYSPDYVRAMYLMMQQDSPDDYILATGIQHTIDELLDIAFSKIGVGFNEKWAYIMIDEKFMRPSDVQTLLGDSSKIRNKLGWEPTVSFEQMIYRMIKYDINELGGHYEKIR